MTPNASHNPHHRGDAAHIADVQTTLGEATTSATELGDLLSAGLAAADDQQRQAEFGAAPQAQRADDSDVR